MGCRLPTGYAICPAEITDGELRIWIGSNYISYYNKGFKYNFKLNNIGFPYSTIRVYLENETHKMVIRKDNTYSIYLKDNTLIAFGGCELSSIFSQLQGHKAGFFSRGRINDGYGNAITAYPITIANIKDIDNEAILSIHTDNTAYLINPKECVDYIKDAVEKKEPYLKIIQYDEDTLMEASGKYKIPIIQSICGSEVLI